MQAEGTKNEYDFIHRKRIERDVACMKPRMTGTSKRADFDQYQQWSIGHTHTGQVATETGLRAMGMIKRGSADNFKRLS